MKCLVVASCLLAVCYGAGLSGSYLPGTTTGVVYGGSGLGGVGGVGGFGGLGSGVRYYGSGQTGGVAYGDGAGSLGSYSAPGEVSYFPGISHDAKAFEYGDASVLTAFPSNEVHFYGGPSVGEKTRLRIHLNSAGRKTNVLFVKSPEAGSAVIPEIVAPKSITEDRTSVFVLSKKPESVGSITIPAGLTNNIVKARPEVYYLKYDNIHDAERAVAESAAGGRNIGTGVHQLNKDTFVRTLDDIRGSGSGIGGFGVSGLGVGGFGVGGLGVSGGHGGLTVLGGSGGHGGLFGSGSRYGAAGASGPY